MDYCYLDANLKKELMNDLEKYFVFIQIDDLSEEKIDRICHLLYHYNEELLNMDNCMFDDKGIYVRMDPDQAFFNHVLPTEINNVIIQQIKNEFPDKEYQNNVLYGFEYPENCTSEGTPEYFGQELKLKALDDQYVKRLKEKEAANVVKEINDVLKEIF